MVKRFYSRSLLAAYSSKKKNRSLVYSIVTLTSLILFVVYSFFGSGQDEKIEQSSPVNFRAVDSDLSRNLQWLNHPLLLKTQVRPPRRIPVLKHAVDQTRLNAGSLIFSRQEVKSRLSGMDRVEQAPGRRRLVAGEVLHAVLESAIQSDFAGPVRAILSEPAYAYNSRRLLLPAGTRIVGNYKNSVRTTQVRVGIRWQRMVLPNGSSVVFDAPATDPMGRVGVRASRVNTHFWKRFGEAGLYSLLSAGAQLSGGADASSLTAGQLLRTQVAGSFADTAMSDLDKNKDIPPTIYLDPGSEVSIFVRRDIIF